MNEIETRLLILTKWLENNDESGLQHNEYDSNSEIPDLLSEQDIG